MVEIAENAVNSLPSAMRDAGPCSADGSKSFFLKDEAVENHRSLKVRVIGAGLSGVYLGIRIPHRLRNVDLKIYEKNAGVGGTWWENRYPGCACDIPGMHRARIAGSRGDYANETAHERYSTLLPVLV